jgi:type II secretory pathway component PulF
MESDTVGEVETRLRSLGFSSIRVRRAYLRVHLRRLNSLKWWISKRDRMIVSFQLRTMREAGLPLLQCLDILEDQHVGPIARRLRGIKRALKTGMGPVEAFATAAGDLFASSDSSAFGLP